MRGKARNCETPFSLGLELSMSYHPFLIWKISELEGLLGQRENLSKLCHSVPQTEELRGSVWRLSSLLGEESSLLGEERWSGLFSELMGLIDAASEFPHPVKGRITDIVLMFVPWRVLPVAAVKMVRGSTDDEDRLGNEVLCLMKHLANMFALNSLIDSDSSTSSNPYLLSKTAQLEHLLERCNKDGSVRDLGAQVAALSGRLRRFSEVVRRQTSLEPTLVDELRAMIDTASTLPPAVEVLMADIVLMFVTDQVMHLGAVRRTRSLTADEKRTGHELLSLVREDLSALVPHSKPKFPYLF